MANYNSKFNINEAFEDFKQKQEEKSKLENPMSSSRTGTAHHSKKLSQSQAVYGKERASKSKRRWDEMTHIQDNFMRDMQENPIFLSQDKVN